MTDGCGKDGRGCCDDGKCGCTGPCRDGSCMRRNLVLVAVTALLLVAAVAVSYMLY